MKNHLDRTFAQLQKKKKRALIAYLAAGYPRFNEQTRIIREMELAGADILELGVPFSDPIADGPTIQFASQQSLKAGTSLRKILKWAQGLRQQVQIPFVVMSYMNPIYAFGIDAFAKAAKASGVSGLIVPDLIPEEGDALRRSLDREGIHLIYLVAPTTSSERQRRLARSSKGFLYAVSVTGVTGARKNLPASTKTWLNKLRGMSRAPVCVGFGISGPAQIRELRSSVDGFIVGSALVDVIRKNSSHLRAKRMGKFVQSLSKECFYGR